MRKIDSKLVLGIAALAALLSNGTSVMAHDGGSHAVHTELSAGPLGLCSDSGTVDARFVNFGHHLAISLFNDGNCTLSGIRLNGLAGTFSRITVVAKGVENPAASDAELQLRGFSSCGSDFFEAEFGEGTITPLPNGFFRYSMTKSQAGLSGCNISEIWLVSDADNPNNTLITDISVDNHPIVHFVAGKKLDICDLADFKSESCSPE